MENQFLQHLKHLADYWERQEISDKEKLEGLTFSMLVMLDGGSGDMPGFAVRPIGENGDEGKDIAGSLHEKFHQT